MRRIILTKLMRHIINLTSERQFYVILIIKFYDKYILTDSANFFKIILKTNFHIY